MSKILGINLTMRWYDSKRSNVMKNMDPNEKLQSYVIKFCGRSYMHISIIEMRVTLSSANCVWFG